MEVYWLPRGRPITQFFELRKGVKALIKVRDYDHVKEMHSKEFIQILE